jgi:Leucine Rich repeats (2 copies)
LSKKLSIPSLLALMLVFVLTAGCKVEITVPEGGKVVSASHAYDCDSGKICVVEVNDFHFAEKFDAQAWEGWVFIGWKVGRGYLCQRSDSVCHLSNKGLGQYEAMSAIVESDETFFLEPEFVKGTPYDEALANVQDESLRQCLNNVPAPRRYAQQVRNVDCSNAYRIGSVQGIEAFSRIESLALNGNGSLTDLRPLGKLSRLQSLSLILRSSYFNAAALGELKLLHDLFLGFIPTEEPNLDLTEMGNLQSLRRLTLGALIPLDLNAIGSLVNLRELEFLYTQISDIGPLAAMTKLEILDLGGAQISDIGPLAGMTKMKTLDLRGNQISDIGPLAGLKNLENLYLNSNQINDAGPLAGMKYLETLDLSSNEIRDIGPLAGMKNLETLDLSSNEISDIGPLAEIDSIPRLYLQNNLIHDASPFKQHYPLTLDPSFGPGIDFNYYLGFVLGSLPAPFGVSLDLSSNPIISVGDALNGIRAGGIFLIDVPLMCQEYPRLVEQYDPRAIITDRVHSGGYAWLYTYKLPERCI